MELKIFQKGFNYSQDGTGNRLVYHLQGCNMRCPWCSNPEGIFLESSKTVRTTVAELVNETINSRLMFFDGGGVTLTGGEVTCQFKAVRELLIELKKVNISTCIETNATSENLKELLPFIDILIMDFKHYDEEKHFDVTKVSNKKVKENIFYLCREEKEVLIRIPLIHGFNDSFKDIDGFLNFFENLNTDKFQFEFLAYHEYGRNKYDELNLPYPVENGAIEAVTLEYFKKSFIQKGHTVIQT